MCGFACRFGGDGVGQEIKELSGKMLSEAIIFLRRGIQLHRRCWEVIVPAGTVLTLKTGACIFKGTVSEIIDRRLMAESS